MALDCVFTAFTQTMCKECAYNVQGICMGVIRDDSTNLPENLKGSYLFKIPTLFSMY